MFNLNNKKLVLLSLDGCLCESKMPITFKMAGLIENLLEKCLVGVISGGAYAQFKVQLLDNLPLLDRDLEKLYLFPTCATSFYRFQNKKWEKIYAEEFSEEEKKKIFAAFKKCFKETGYITDATPKYGEILEDRLSQITCSCLGQKAPLSVKKEWDPSFVKRLTMIEFLRTELKDFNISAGGTSSIDIVRGGVDKSYCLPKIKEHLNIKQSEILYVGNKFYEKFGEDYPIKAAGVDCVEVANPIEMEEVIVNILNGQDAK